MAHEPNGAGEGAGYGHDNGAGFGYGVAMDYSNGSVRGDGQPCWLQHTNGLGNEDEEGWGKPVVRE